MGENTILERARAGDKHCFEKLMTQYLETIYNYTRYQISQDEDRQDVIQEVMLSAYQGIEKFNQNSSIKTWLLGITRRKVADFYRKKYAKKTVPLENDITKEESMSVLDKLSISSVVDSLPSDDKELVFFVFQQGLSYKEISSILEIPVGTVKSRMHQLKDKLKALLMDDWRSLYE